MNNSLAIPNEGPWPLGPLGPDAGVLPGQRTYSATNILDFPTFMRIVYHWRWLVLGGIGLGFVAAILFTLLTTPIYRAWVTLEANPPVVAVSDEQSKERESSNVNSFDFVATQVGLLSSKSVAERTAQELNLANNATVVGQSADASQRLRAATGVVTGGLKVIPPQEGTLIKFSYDSPSPQLAAMVANGIADSFINTALQRRYEASAYARNFLERQIAKTRGDLERSERSLAEYAQQQGIISTSTGADGKPSISDANSLQGESLIALNTATVGRGPRT